MRKACGAACHASLCVHILEVLRWKVAAGTRRCYAYGGCMEDGMRVPVRRTRSRNVEQDFYVNSKHKSSKFDLVPTWISHCKYVLLMYVPMCD